MADEKIATKNPTNENLDNDTKDLLKEISDYNGSEFKGAYNIRVNCKRAERKSTENIKIEDLEGKPGLAIKIAPNTKGETVYIPACVTKAGIQDVTYNDFYVGEGADVTIVAGCGVHTETGEPARHNGIHRFFCGKNSHVLYLEKHIGGFPDRLSADCGLYRCGSRRCLTNMGPLVRGAAGIGRCLCRHGKPKAKSAGTAYGSAGRADSVCL